MNFKQKISKIPFAYDVRISISPDLSKPFSIFESKIAFVHHLSTPLIPPLQR
jgi:hypothetical protein